MNQADTAWMLVSTALVLLMTPALAFFYGGLVRSKHVLNAMMMSFVSLGVIGVRVGRGRLLAGVCAGQRVGGRDLAGVPPRRRSRGQRNDSAPALHVLPGHVRDHHGGADLGRHRRAHAVPGLRRLHHVVVGRRVQSRSPTGCGEADGSPRWARSTSPAGRSCTSTPASRRWSPPRLSDRDATIRRARFSRTAFRSRCLAPDCCGSGGSASTRAAPWPPTASRSSRSPRPCSRRPATLVVWMLLDIGRSRNPTAVGAATAIVVGLVAITPAAGFVGPMSALAIGGHRGDSQLLRVVVSRTHVARRFARRRRSPWTGRHGRRAADRRLCAEEPGTASPTVCCSATPDSSGSRLRPSPPPSSTAA